MATQVHGSEWARIVTPLQVPVWQKYLEGHPDGEFAQLVMDGIRDGFRVGFDYVTCECKAGPGNMKSVELQSQRGS